MKRLYYTLLVLYYGLCGYALYSNYIHDQKQAFMMVFASIALSFIAPIIFKIRKWKPVYEVYILALVFLSMASLLGSAYRFYTLVPYWDKITHLCSGVLGLLAAYCIFCGLKKTVVVKSEDYKIMVIFIHAVNIAIAALWEQYEYVCLLVADYDAIRHYSTGVHDSMSDITAAIIGGIITSIFIVHHYHTKKPNFFTNIYEKFYLENIAK